MNHARRRGAPALQSGGQWPLAAAPQRHHRQGARRTTNGYAALATIVLLCLAAALSLAAVERAVVTHERVQGHASRHAVAFEAAEAGLDWALSQLADPMAIDAQCNDVAATSGSRSFLQTYLTIVPASRAVTPTSDHGTGLPLQPTCTRNPVAGAVPPWQCRCPSDGHPGPPLAAIADAAWHPTFSVRFEAASVPGSLQIVATGCTQVGGACTSSGGAVDAVAQVRAIHAILPALTTLPSAALTALGDVRTTAALEVRNDDAWSGGTAVQSAGVVDLPNAVLVAPAGSSSSTGVVQSLDSGLSMTTGDQLFRQLTALDRHSWQRLPAVQSADCAVASGCEAALAAASGRVPGPASLRIAGDATISGPLDLGTADRPVLLVVAGRLTLSGTVRITGLVAAGSVVWNHGTGAGADGGVTGAMVSEATYGGTGSPRIAYDLGVLERLRATGQVVRVPGGWRDF